MTNKKKFNSTVLKALQGWAEFAFEGNNPFETLEQYKLLTQNDLYLDRASKHRAINKILLNGINEMESTFSEGAKILKRRFIDDFSVSEVAYEMKLTEDQFKPRQRKAVESLAKSILSFDTDLKLQAKDKMKEFIPAKPVPTYGRLADLEALRKLTMSNNDVWQIAISGIGGIGKTHLAINLAHQILKSSAFIPIAWFFLGNHSENRESLERTLFQTLYEQLVKQGTIEISIEAQTKAVRKYLEKHACIVFIDNVETHEEWLALTELLGRYRNPTKLIFTSRYQAYAEVSTHIYELGQLSQSDTLHFMRVRIKQLGLNQMSEISDESLLKLWELVGGNPLAIRIMTGLMTILSTSELLDELAAVHSEQVHRMYRHIFNKAWDILSPSAKSLLKTMPLVGSSGLDLDHLRIGTGLERNKLIQAISELKRLSLIEVLGNLSIKRYGIHPLTEAFIRSDIIKI